MPSGSWGAITYTFTDECAPLTEDLHAADPALTRPLQRTISHKGIEPAAIVERDPQRTAGRRIADPSACLLRMARDEAAKRLGVPAAALAALGAAMAERATSVGAIPEPSWAVLGVLPGAPSGRGSRQSDCGMARLDSGASRQ
jgi:hypothetical protein